MPVPTRLAGATSLQLELPVADAAPWTAETLFAWTQYSLLSPQPGTIAEPDPASVTVIELPYRLDLALDRDAGWVQPPTPAPDAANSPLWHARLGVQLERSDGTGLFVNERSILVKHARATWTYDTPGAPSAFAYEALNPAAREDIVYETEQINVPDTDITLDHLILSPLGAWADLRSSWPGGTPPAGHLAAWTQIISQGRDQYVRAVTVGYLLPWGHVASVVEVAERRFSGDAENTAYLCAKSYIVVGEVTRTYINADGSQVQLDAVLTQVDLLTQITPTIDQTTGAITVNDGTGPAFIPYVGGQPFLFHARVYDNDQLSQPPRKTADTYLGAIFVDASSSQALITAALNAYNTPITSALAGAKANGLIAAALAFSGISRTFNGDLANSLTLNSTITTAPAGPVPIPTVSTMVATVSNFTLSGRHTGRGLRPVLPPERHYGVGKVVLKGESHLVEVHRFVSGKPEDKLTVIAEVTGKNEQWYLVNFLYPNDHNLLGVLKALQDDRAQPTS